MREGARGRGRHQPRRRKPVEGGIEGSGAVGPRWGVGVAVGVVVVLLACYWLTLAPSISEGDSGEIAAAVHGMGVIHPTGYPLYLIVGKLFDLLPVGEPAHRIALLSAVAGAAAGGLLCWVVIVVSGSGAAGVLGGLVFGLNRWIWPQANQVEVYAFSVFLLALLVTMFVRWSAQRSPRRLQQLALCCGLALTHHRIAMFFVAPMLLWAVVSTRPASARLLGRTLGWVVLPLLLYLWLPWRSAHHPLADWGNTAGSLQFFLTHISGSLYYDYVFGDTAANALMQTKLSLAWLWRQFTVVGVALTLVGLWGLVRWRRSRAAGVILIISFVLVGVWSAFYRVPDRAAFYTPDALAVSIWCGAGLGCAVEVARAGRWRVLRLAPAGAWLVAVGLALSMLLRNWNEVDRSRQHFHSDLAAWMGTGIPPQSVIVIDGDQYHGAALYYYTALHHGPAPVLFNAYSLYQPWFQPLLQPELRGALDRSRHLSHDKPGWQLPYAIRERLDPRRRVYTNIPVDKAPPGFVLLKDFPLSAMVAAPGIPEAADAPGWRPLLQLPAGAGELLHVAIPARAARAEAFAITASIRWSAAAPPRGDLVFVFAHHDIAGRVARGELKEEDLPDRLGLYRRVPVLFGLSLPGGRGGHHYQQAVRSLLYRRMTPGRYHVFVGLRSSRVNTPLIPVGVISVS